MAKKAQPKKQKAPRGESNRRCYYLADTLGEINCAIDDIRKAARSRNANDILLPLYTISFSTKQIAGELGADASTARSLANRGSKLRKVFGKKGLAAKRLTTEEARFLQEDAQEMWAHARKLEETASKSCSWRPRGMVHPLGRFQPIPKAMGKTKK